MVAAKTPELLKKAVHQHRLLSKKGLLERLFTAWFDSFVYNQIWEDPRVDLEALKLDRTSRVLTIASGGCNVLNYLVHQPQSITAVDLNCYHIYLTNLKLAAARHLPEHAAFFDFFGNADSDSNLDNYERHISAHLDEETRAFWESGKGFRKIVGPRIEYFSKNFYNHAKLGHLLRFIHKLARIARKDPARILEASNQAEREQIFNEQIAPFFDNGFVRFIGRQPLIMFSLGIPPSQYQALRSEMPSDDIMDLYRERVRRLTCDFPIDDNYFTWQALSRCYDVKDRRAIPDYLRQENFDLVRSGVERVRTHVCTVTDHLKTLPAGALDRFVLLDSQDWMTPDVLQAQWEEIARVGAPGTRVIFRTGSSQSPIESALSPELRQHFVYEREVSQALHKKDRAAIYGGFHLYVKRD